MSKLIDNINEIIYLAEKVQKLIEHGKIDKGKNELKEIMKIDIEEYKKIQAEFDDKKVLQECQTIFNQAKKALQDLDNFTLFNEAKELIDKIIELEKHELSEIREDEKKKNELYEIWNKEFHNIKCYHATSDYFRDSILKHGLDPNIKPEIFGIAAEIYDLLHELFYYQGYNEALKTKKPVFVSIGYFGFSVYNVPEVIRELVSELKSIISLIPIITESNGDYLIYTNLCKMKRIFMILGEKEFRKITNNTKKIIDYYNILKQFKEHSKQLALEIDIEAIIDDPNLPNEFKNAVKSFDFFYKKYYPKYKTNWNECFNHSTDDFEVTGKIEPRYIHIK